MLDIILHTLGTWFNDNRWGSVIGYRNNFYFVFVVHPCLYCNVSSRPLEVDIDGIS